MNTNGYGLNEYVTNPINTETMCSKILSTDLQMTGVLACGVVRVGEIALYYLIFFIFL